MRCGFTIIEQSRYYYQPTFDVVCFVDCSIRFEQHKLFQRIPSGYVARDRNAMYLLMDECVKSAFGDGDDHVPMVTKLVGVRTFGPCSTHPQDVMPIFTSTLFASVRVLRLAVALLRQGSHPLNTTL